MSFRPIRVPDRAKQEREHECSQDRADCGQHRHRDGAGRQRSRPHPRDGRFYPPRGGSGDFRRGRLRADSRHGGSRSRRGPRGSHPGLRELGSAHPHRPWQPRPARGLAEPGTRQGRYVRGLDRGRTGPRRAVLHRPGHRVRARRRRGGGGTPHQPLPGRVGGAGARALLPRPVRVPADRPARGRQGIHRRVREVHAWPAPRPVRAGA